jgi:16S rRNA (uracil1498-N3)-methyltransferase
MHERFYAPGVADGCSVALPAEEGEHLARVMRLREGHTVAVFDGRGHEYLAVVESIGRRKVVVRATGPRAAAPEPKVRLTVALAVTKGGRMESAVRDAAMLGASVIQPVVTSRTEARVESATRGSRRDRWQRVAISSVKQCGRAVVPMVGEVLVLADYLARESSQMRLQLVEPQGDRRDAGPTTSSAGPMTSGSMPTLAALSTPDSAALLIGPEGGWAPEEIDAARRAGFHPITLGQRTLRADATPIAAIAVLQFIWGDL